MCRSEKHSLGHIVQCAVLCDSDESGLVVRRRVDRGDAVRTGGKTAGDISGEDAVLRGRVETLEEHELGRVRRRLAVQAGERVDDDVRVAVDVARRGVDLLGCGEVVLGRVHEIACDEVPDGHLDREVLVRGNGGAVLREHELGRGHVREGGDNAHWRGVARPGRDLQPVREGFLDGGAEVDEVV